MDIKQEIEKINPNYIKKLVTLAKEIHEMQLAESGKYKYTQLKNVPMEQVLLTSKINYLIGYITALEEKDYYQLKI